MIRTFYITITPFFPSKTNFRGAYIYDQVKTIQNEGKYDVIVLKPKSFYSKKNDYVYEGVNVFFFSVYDLPSAIFPGLFNVLSFLSLKRKLRKLNISIENIAIVHAHVTATGIYPVFLKKQVSTIKTVLQHHGFDVLSLSNGILAKFHWHRNWVKAYGIKICNQIDLHVGVSAKTLECVAEIPEIKMKSQYILYNGVDVKKFYPITGIKDPSYFTIGCIANFWPLKDQITLIKAVEKLIEQGCYNVRIKFIGSGETLSDAKEYVKVNELGAQIDFLAEIDHSKLIRFYNALDLFVLPSYYEAFGCVYTEAYYCGVPFMAVKNQGIAELIPNNDKDKWLIDKGDYVKLAELIQDYMDNLFSQNILISLDINLLIKSYIKYVKDLKKI
jgi:glycosyltransferase involved in cell wall biosynthesis